MLPISQHFSSPILFSTFILYTPDMKSLHQSTETDTTYMDRYLIINCAAFVIQFIIQFIIDHAIKDIFEGCRNSVQQPHFITDMIM